MTKLCADEETGVDRQLASSLADVAERLQTARNVAELQAALADHRAVWNKLAQLAAQGGWQAPRRLVDYAQSLRCATGRGVTDYHVESLIRVNRNAARDILGRV